MSERAWEFLKGKIGNPPYPVEGTVRSREEVEARIRISPENTANVIELARLNEQAGDHAAARKMILDVAVKDGAKSWFLHKAAHLLAEDGKFAEAVEMMLREK